MDLKDFLMPSPRKIFVFIIMFGLPFMLLYRMWISFDFVFWYLISCLIVWMYESKLKS
jgi:hypothetical protein